MPQPPRLIPRPSSPVVGLPTRSKTKHHKTISTAAILKRKPMEALSGHSKRAAHRRRREKVMHPLMMDYQDDMTAVLASASSRASSSLSGAHAGLLARVGIIKNSNSTLLSTLQTQSGAALAPLDVQTTDEQTTEVAGDLAHQLTTFRTSLLAAEEKLTHLWTLWTSAQEEIEAIGEEVRGTVEGGYKHVLAGWEDEVREKVAEMEGEVKLAGEEAVKRMGEAEKEIDRRLREEQARLVAEMF
ncbi:hypothetical protein V495_08119, partial [Pseudogymnoascus sp. VKM F-4514 (FW-929)]